AIWSPEMEDYCQNDVEVNFAVWQVIESFRQPRQVQDEEQDIQSLVTYMEQNGYPFLVAEAEKLAKELQLEFDRLVRAVSVGVKGKFVPHKKHVVGPLWDDPNGINEKKRYARPRREWGEDKSRSWWGEITIPKKSMKSSDPTKRGDRTEGAAYCPAKFKEFTPTSRDQVRELLRDEYAWKPTEWTEKGNPKIDDDVLHDLADNHDVPFARDLADIYMIQKLLGYLANGGEAWIKKYNPETECIHPYTNTGGTVTGRCSHAGPNIGQVPSVITKKIDGEEVVLKGREGRYGYECRSLFYTPELVYGVPWKQVGVDLSGIEFRMLAEETAPFDDGELIEIVTTPGKDIHEFHMGKTGINDRNQMKRVTYALLYGAGDNKLGATASPEAPSSEWRRIGQGIRAQMMEGLPALNEVIDKYHTEAGSGVIRAIDGRDLFCRSPHSALNTRLQSSAAIVAKKWAVIAERDLCENLLHGWEGDFAFLAFVHDELQSGAKEEYAEYVAKTIIAAAAKAGKHYNLRCPIDAASKIGRNWAECH
ncbi:MAG: hypothetical protein KJP02_00250, partial [Octadecabacter sp.]|nr:hypothetical protein [Octadecabacter sp.]